MEGAVAGLDPRMFVVVGGIIVAAILVVFAFRSSPEQQRRHLKQRLDRSSSGKGGQSKKAQEAVSVKLNTSDSILPGLDLLVKKFMPHPELMRARLRKTGYALTIGEYLLVNLLITLIVGFLVYRLVSLPWLPALLAGIAVGVGLPHMFVGMLINRRLKKFTSLFPEAIDLIVRGLKSGLPVTESFKVVGEEMSDPVGIEFRNISDSMKLGQTMEEAMWEAARRLDTAEFKFFVISLSVQRETGGNLTETLDNLSDILRKRRQMRSKVRAMSSEARASAIIIGSLPFIMFAIIYLINSGYITQLFTDPRGIAMVIAGIVSMGIGILVMAKMIRFEI